MMELELSNTQWRETLIIMETLIMCTKASKHWWAKHLLTHGSLFFNEMLICLCWHIQGLALKAYIQGLYTSY